MPVMRWCFNSQPPEGGWVAMVPLVLSPGPFQLTAARRRLAPNSGGNGLGIRVSTHSRPKAAGHVIRLIYKNPPVSTHSRPKAAGKPWMP